MDNLWFYIIIITVVLFISLVVVLVKYYKISKMYTCILELDTKGKKYPQRQHIDLDEFEKQIRQQGVWYDSKEYPPRDKGSNCSTRILIQDKDDRYCLGWFWHGSMSYSIFIEGKTCTVNEFIKCKRWCYIDDII